MPTMSAPRISIYCRCGAQWHGQHAVGNHVVDYHAEHCGPPISEREYVLLTKRAPRKPQHWTRDDDRQD